MVIRAYRRLVGAQDGRAFLRGPRPDGRVLLALEVALEALYPVGGSGFQDRYRGRCGDMPNFFRIRPTVTSETHVVKLCLIKSLIKLRVHNAMPNP